MEELFAEVLKNPLVLILIILAGPMIMALFSTRSSNKNAAAWRDLTNHIIENQGTLQDRQTKADEDSARALQEMAEHSRATHELLALNRHDLNSMRDAMDELGNQTLDAIATLSGLNVNHFNELVTALRKIQLGQGTITALLEGIQDGQRVDSETIAVLADGVRGYNSRIDTIITQVTGIAAIINARLPSDTTPTIIS